MAAKLHLSIFVFAMIGCIVSVSSTTTHNVGDSEGWAVPSYPGFYEDWAKNRTFAVGDVLCMCYFLNYSPSLFSSKSRYYICAFQLNYLQICVT